MTYKVANIQSLWYPIRWDTSRQPSGNTINVLSSGSTVCIDITVQSGFMVRVSNKEHTLDSIEASPSQSRQSIDSSSSSLTVTLKNETMSRIRSKSGSDSINDVGSTRS